MATRKFCDRCDAQIQDGRLRSKERRLTVVDEHQGQHHEYDLCSPCMQAFSQFWQNPEGEEEEG